MTIRERAMCLVRQKPRTQMRWMRTFQLEAQRVRGT
jgi:hypothetical protein